MEDSTDNKKASPNGEAIYLRPTDAPIVEIKADGKAYPISKSEMEKIKKVLPQMSNDPKIDFSKNDNRNTIWHQIGEYSDFKKEGGVIARTKEDGNTIEAFLVEELSSADLPNHYLISKGEYSVKELNDGEDITNPEGNFDSLDSKVYNKITASDPNLDVWGIVDTLADLEKEHFAKGYYVFTEDDIGKITQKADRTRKPTSLQDKVMLIAKLEKNYNAYIKNNELRNAGRVRYELLRYLRLAVIQAKVNKKDAKKFATQYKKIVEDYNKIVVGRNKKATSSKAKKKLAKLKEIHIPKLITDALKGAVQGKGKGKGKGKDKVPIMTSADASSDLDVLYELLGELSDGDPRAEALCNTIKDIESKRAPPSLKVSNDGKVHAPPKKYAGRTSGLWCKDCGDFHDFEVEGCNTAIVKWTKNGYKYQ